MSKQEVEYWNYDCNMSRRALSDVLYATILCDGEIVSTYAGLNPKQYSRRQNSQNTVLLKIKLPKGEKEDWEDIVGGELEEPPKAAI